MSGLKLNHVSKRGHRALSYVLMIHPSIAFRIWNENLVFDTKKSNLNKETLQTVETFIMYHKVCTSFLSPIRTKCCYRVLHHLLFFLLSPRYLGSLSIPLCIRPLFLTELQSLIIFKLTYYYKTPAQIDFLKWKLLWLQSKFSFFFFFNSSSSWKSLSYVATGLPL